MLMAFKQSYADAGCAALFVVAKLVSLIKDGENFFTGGFGLGGGFLTVWPGIGYT